MTLTWDTGGGNHVSYSVASGVHPSGTLTTQTVFSSANRTVTITGLTNGTTYRFRVRAVGHSGHTGSAWTSFVTATPSFWSATLTPVKFGAANEYGCSGASGARSCATTSILSTRSFTYDGGSENVLRLSHNNASNRLTLTTSPIDADAFRALTLHVGSNSYAVTSATASHNSAGSTAVWTTSGVSWSTSQLSVSLTAQQQVASVPAQPAGLSVTAGDSKLDLSWTAPSGTLTGYDVHYTSAPTIGAGAVGNSALVQTTTNPLAENGWIAVDRGTESSPPVASQSITGLDNGTAYRVRVRAKGAGGAGTWAVESATPMAQQTMTPSTNALVSNVGQAAGSSEEGLQISTSAVAQGFTTGTNTGGYTLTSIDVLFNTAVGTPANLRVELWSATSGGAPNAKIASLTVPSTVSGTATFSAPSGTTLDASTSYFVVFYRSGTTTGALRVFSSTAEDSGGQSGWAVTDTSHFLSSGTWTAWSSYLYGIRVNGAQAQATVPAAPTGLSLSPGDSKLDATWTAPSGTLTGYDVHYTSSTTVAAGAAALTGMNPSPASGWVAVDRGTEASPPVASQEITGLDNGTAYRVRVRAKNASGDGAWAVESATPMAQQTMTPSANALVSNVGQAAGSSEEGLQVSTSAVAQGFTTGTNTGGYTLTSIDVLFNTAVGTPANLRVELWSATSGGAPNAKIASLTVPSTVSGTATFSAPSGTTLDASTSYFVVFYRSGTTTGALRVFSSTAEDSGGQSGWAVTDTSHFLSSGTWTAWSSYLYGIRVNGAAKQTTTPSTGIWSATLTPGQLSNALGCDNGATAAALKCSTAATLDEDEFSHGGTDYTVYGISLASGGLTFGLDTNNPSGLSGLKLCVGTASSFAIADATISSTALTAAWSNTGLSWTAGTPVKLSLVPSSSACAQTTTPAVAPPTALVVTPGNGQLALSWTASTTSGLIGYDVHYTSAPETGPGAVADEAARLSNRPASEGWKASSTPLSAAATITGLDNGTRYRVRVRAATTSHESAWLHGSGTPAAPKVPVLTQSDRCDGLAAGKFWSHPGTDHLRYCDGQNWQYAVTANARSKGTSARPLFTGADRTLVYISADANNGRTIDAVTGAELGTASDSCAAANFGAMQFRATGRASRVYFCNGSAWTAITLQNARPDFAPSLSTGSRGGAVVGTQTYTVGVAIEPLVLPAAAGGDAPLSYTLATLPAGLTFTASTRTLSGTPTTVGSYTMTYTVTDGDSSSADTDTVSFGIQVRVLPPTALMVAQGFEKLDLRWTAPSGFTLTGFDVHYTSAAATGSNAVADSAAVQTASNATAAGGWLAVSRGTEASPPATTQTIGSLDNGTVYRVRVRAKSAGGDSAWLFGTGTPQACLVDCSQLTGISFSDGVRTLPMERNNHLAPHFDGALKGLRADGRPVVLYSVHVPPGSIENGRATTGIASLDVTPVWTDPGLGVVIMEAYDVAGGGNPSGVAALGGRPQVFNGVASDSGDAVPVTLAATGTTLLHVYLGSGEDKADYWFYLQPNAHWKSAETRLNNVSMRAGGQNSPVRNYPLEENRGSGNQHSRVYRVKVPHDVTEVTLVAEQRHRLQYVSVNGESRYFPVPVVEGKNLLDVEVTAEDERYKRRFRVVVTREAPPGALTAAFERVPESHGGTEPFWLSLRLSEGLGEGARAPAKASFAVEGGTVKRVQRRNGQLYRVRVAPDSWRDVTVTLTGGLACDAEGAVCTADGRALSAAASATIAGPKLLPLTAAFENVPPEHDGKAAFALDVRFSEPLGKEGVAPVAASFSVRQGAVKGVKRIEPGLWRVRIKPDSWRDVSVTLAPPAGCAAKGAVCAFGGRALSNAPDATVGGPARIQVADAKAREGKHESLDFAVTLSRAASGEVSVDYATADGTATAGEDYTAVSGTLVFAAGETAKTVRVPLLDDAVDEGDETFLLRLSNPRGAYLRKMHREATGTIRNDDPLQKMWLSRFGRTVGSQVAGAVSDRLDSGLAPGAHATFAGQALDLSKADDGKALAEAMTGFAQAFGAPGAPANDDDPGSGAPGSGPGQAGAGPFARAHGLSGPWWDGPGAASAPARAVTGRELLLGSSFHVAGGGEGSGPGLAAWGRVAHGSFDGEEASDAGATRVDGTVTTGTLGADAEWSRVLAGVAVSLSEGEGGFSSPGVDRGASGKIESTMTTVSPYARVKVTERVSAWGLAGWGTGHMTIRFDDGAMAPVRTDLAMRLGALGARGALLTQDATGGMDLVLKADAFLVTTESEKAANSAETSADASRVRLVLEGGRRFDLSGGATFRPSLELGVRHDGGDAETGTGVELGGGVAFADPASGLSVEARARMLVAHADSDYEEWGASATARLDPGERGRGLSFSLSPTLGAASSAADRLWGAHDARALAPGGGFDASRGLQGEMGYGMALFGDRFTGTPNLGFGLSDGGARDWRLGWRLTPAGGGGFEVNLDATRSEPANDNAGHGVMLRGAIRW